MNMTKWWWEFIPRERGPAAANDRSPNDDVVCGTATAPDLRPALPVAAAEVVITAMYYNKWPLRHAVFPLNYQFLYVAFPLP